jgi:cation diffusion facilitator family transporter
VLAGAVVFILFFSVADVVQGVKAPPHLIALLVAVVTWGTNTYLSKQGFCAARHLGSPVLRTSAEHNRADAISSLATVVGVGGALLGLHVLDPAIAIFETLHIVWLSGSLLGHALRGLMDASLPSEQISGVDTVCRQVPGVIDVLSLRTRQSGPQPWVDIEVAVERSIPVADAHEITNAVRGRVEQFLGRTSQIQVKFRSMDGGQNARLQPGAATDG